MPSFDVVSEVDLQEARNAVDQANREVGTRFDFKGVDAKFELAGGEISLRAEQEFQLNQMMDILRQKLVKRKVDVACMDIGEPETSLNAAQIQGEQLRVTGKKRDDLQQVIALLKEGKYGLPLQFTNFRD